MAQLFLPPPIRITLKILLFISAIAHAEEIFIAKYHVKFGGLRCGTMTAKLSKHKNQFYEYSQHLESKLFFYEYQQEEISRFQRTHDGEYKPISYSFLKKDRSSNKKYEIHFDGDSAHVYNASHSNDFIAHTESLDKLLMQLYLIDKVRFCLDGEINISQISDKGVRHYKFNPEISENFIKISAEQGNRAMSIVLSPTHSWLPVRFEQTGLAGSTFQGELDSFTVYPGWWH